jgi:hypothetical protein
MEELPMPKGQFLGEVSWIKTLGGSGDDTAQAVVPTADGGYAILGFTNSLDGDIQDKDLAVNDYWLIKLDAEGRLEWNKTYGGSKDDRGQSLSQTFDGGYILTGYSMSSDGDATVNKGFHDNWLLKLDSFGNIEWEKSFGFSGHDHSYDVLQTDDGGYFFTGFLDVTSARADGFAEKAASLTRHGVGEFWGTKINAQAEIEWRGYFGGTNNDRAHAVVPSDDGGFVMAGFTESNDFDVSNTQGSYDFWLVKVDSEGNMLWETSYGGSGIDIAHDITRCRDGGYVVVGSTFSANGNIGENKGESDVWMIKINEVGTLEWERTLGGTRFDAAQAVVESHNGGFLVVGNSKSTDVDVNSNQGENDIWVIRTNRQGQMVWQRSFGGSSLDFGFDVVERLDGSVLVVGQTQSIDFDDMASKGGIDAVLIKIQ